jgi:glutaredoxin
MSWVRPLLLVCTLWASLAPAGGCAKRDDGSDPAGKEELPPLTLRDDTPELLLTWIDERGGTHTATSVGEVPAAGRNPVRVIVRDAGQGQLFYVADLGAKQADGSYPVRTMPRGEWEALIESRRAKLASHRAPRPLPGPSGSSGQDGALPPPSARPDEPRPEPTPAGTVRAIVYGASWCGPCHQAQKFLEKRGVTVTFYDVEREPARGTEMKRKLQSAGRGGGSIPVIDVGGEILVGFNPSALDRAIAKARKEAGTAL